MTSVFNKRNQPPAWITTVGLAVAGIAALWMVWTGFTGPDHETLQTTTGISPPSFSTTRPTRPTASLPTPATEIEADLMNRAAQTAAQSAVGGAPIGPLSPSYIPARIINGTQRATVTSTTTLRNDNAIAIALIQLDVDPSDSPETVELWYTIVYSNTGAEWNLEAVILTRPPDQG